ncbi:TIGR03084 family metal-binding protein [Rhodococcus sp. X156]|uniref:TIGR03084 family metal-binding protein n=1 Tax=Rhodococcus sp. X156 TaxID=2499145 RepID=UPI000FDC47B7|nr:TIGR03084 family metal-binding protein [Rhodococcus sp. X156]
MSALDQLLTDLAEENDDLDARVADLPDSDWARGTPAAGWTVAHQVAHLAWTDQVAVLAATDLDGFTEVLTGAAADPMGFVDAVAERDATQPPPQLLQRWRQGRAQLLAALAAATPGEKLPWFGPPMSPTSMATARLMETWAHGQDVADALGQRRVPTARLRHICHIGVRTRGFAYLVNGLTPPTGDVRVELAAPDGELWCWGESDTDVVQGPAEDFCLRVTQRRHLDDLALRTTGAGAEEWLRIAQAFAGPPGPGRAPATVPSS